MDWGCILVQGHRGFKPQYWKKVKIKRQPPPQRLDPHKAPDAHMRINHIWRNHQDAVTELLKNSDVRWKAESSRHYTGLKSSKWKSRVFCTSVTKVHRPPKQLCLLNATSRLWVDALPRIQGAGWRKGEVEEDSGVWTRTKGRRHGMERGDGASAKSSCKPPRSLLRDRCYSWLHSLRSTWKVLVWWGWKTSI